jgi:glycosyltransferase involved in cell wall biosynthesis
VTGVSFIVTVYNKAAYLPRVLAALARQTGPFTRQFVFVDDGSTDESTQIIAEHTASWRDPVLLLRQANRGAAAATNRGAAVATQPWLKLVDGDDLLVPGATANLLAAAEKTGRSFVYGDLAQYRHEDSNPFAAVGPDWRFAIERDPLASFIRNCSGNSSSMLIAAERFKQVGGCDERLISPDFALFLRLFASGGSVHLCAPVALIPEEAPGRLSAQRRRSPYESVLALLYLVSETPGLKKTHAELAYRRALSRAYRYHRLYGGSRVFSVHFLRMVASRLRLPVDRVAAMRKALGAFTEDGRSERPPDWIPGALRNP